MSKFHRYDFASKNYIAKLIKVAAGNDEVSDLDLIPASAEVQDSLSEIRDLSRPDREYVDATSAYIKGLTSVVKGGVADLSDLEADLSDLESAYQVARRRVIVEAPVDSRHAYEAA